MQLEEYQRWLCEDQWQGYRLDEIIFDTNPRAPMAFEGVDLLNAYQALRSLFILTSGFNGEGGEATEHFKKWVRDGRLDTKAAGLELGDRLAYLVWLAKTLGFALEDIAQMNHDKLVARGKKEGFRHDHGA